MLQGLERIGSARDDMEPVIFDFLVVECKATGTILFGISASKTASIANIVHGAGSHCCYGKSVDKAGGRRRRGR